MTKEEKYKMVKKLDEETGYGFNECGYVLNITDWNFEKSEKIIHLMFLREEQRMNKLVTLEEKVSTLEQKLNALENK